MFKKIMFLLATSIFAVCCLQAQDFSLYQKKVLVSKGDSLPYRILLPADFNEKNKYPLIVFLHGSGERGNDNEKQLMHGGDFFLKEDIRKQYPAIVVFPQCPENSSWANISSTYDSSSGKRVFTFNTKDSATTPMRLLEALLQTLPTMYKINMNRINVGGLSMGGFGTFEVVRRNPGFFAGAFPICGGADPETANKMKRVNWWIFHGAKDDVVPPIYSEQMAEALKKAGAQVIFTLYPDAGHNSWDSAFAESTLMPWIYSNSKSRY